MADTTFEYRDLGMAKVKRTLSQLDRGFVLVGWPNDGRKHRTVTHARNKDGDIVAKTWGKSDMTVARLAVIHEFGAPRASVPARPFMRQANSRYGRTELPTAQARLFDAVLTGKLSVAKALAKLGVFWEGRIKLIFREGSFTPLKPATIARKGSSTPLIDSGQLRQSVTSVVKEAG